MVLSEDLNPGQNHSIKIDNKSFERVNQFRYVETSLRNQNSIQKDIMGRLKSECYLSFVAESLSSSFLSKNIKIMMYRTVILPVVLSG
jgi:hypothetical protein